MRILKFQVAKIGSYLYICGLNVIDMRAIWVFVILVSASCTFSCKSDSAQQENVQQENTSQPQEQQDQANDNGSAGKTDDQSASKVEGGHDYTFLTKDIFHVDVSIVSGKDPKEQPYKGVWLDLLPDGSFHYGKFDKTLYSGTWAYNHDMKILAITPNDPNEKRSEWSILANEQMVVLVGTRTYGNNGTQLKLVRSTTFPKQG